MGNSLTRFISFVNDRWIYEICRRNSPQTLFASSGALTGFILNGGEMLTVFFKMALLVFVAAAAPAGIISAHGAGFRRRSGGAAE
jgi:hypothetical protein